MDLARIFVGDGSGLSMLPEIVVRTAILYSFTFVLIRAVTQRISAQISVAELLLIVALGSAVGDPMFYADVPLLHGMTVISVVVLLEKGFGKLIARSDRLEAWLEGVPVQVVDQGVLCLDGLAKRDFARDELMELLRLGGVEQLGEVRAAYIEQSGRVSIFRFPTNDVRPGLPVEPPLQITPRPQLAAGQSARPADAHSCLDCGFTLTLDRDEALPEHQRGHVRWTPARGAGERLNGDSGSASGSTRDGP